MEVKVKQLFDQERVSSVDKLMILMYNITLLTGASYLVYYQDASAWIYLLALLFGATWNQTQKDS
jgi:hypothetical protein